MHSYRSMEFVRSVDFKCLPFVSLEDRVILPDEKGIYFAYVGYGEPIYIGMAQSFLKRWSNHHRTPYLEALSGVKIAWFSIPDISDKDLRTVEGNFIRRYRPTLNRDPLRRHKKVGRKLLKIKPLLYKVSITLHPKKDKDVIDFFATAQKGKLPSYILGAIKNGGMENYRKMLAGSGDVNV